MRKLVLIGGGENGHGNTKYETKEIDEEIVKMTGKEKPIFLFIGLASSFSDSYYDIMKGIYRNLGCETMYLKKKNIINNPDIVKDKIAKADIIYMCGGDTTKLVSTIKEYEIDTLLSSALERGCVLSGISAGAIALATKGLSDYQILGGVSDKYAFTDGLGMIDLTICPHGNSSERITDLQDLLKNTNERALILDNGTALRVEGDNLSIITSIEGAKARFGYYANDEWHEEKI